jgi:hypothetical protein
MTLHESGLPEPVSAGVVLAAAGLDAAAGEDLDGAGAFVPPVVDAQPAASATTASAADAGTSLIASEFTLMTTVH